MRWTILHRRRACVAAGLPFAAAAERLLAAAVALRQAGQPDEPPATGPGVARRASNGDLDGREELREKFVGERREVVWTPMPVGGLRSPIPERHQPLSRHHEREPTGPREYKVTSNRESRKNTS